MKRIFSRLFNSLGAGLLTGVIVTSAIAVPIMTSAQDADFISGTAGIANVTAGDTAYKQAVDAADGQTVKVQVYVLNRQAAGSDKVANNLRVKVALPANPSRSQTITATASGDNTNRVSQTVQANLDRDGSYLQYVPGSAVWKHNTGSNEAVVIEETKLSDEVVTGANGLVLENQKPGYNFASTVTVLARVMNPSVKLTTQSQISGQTNQWSDNNTAKPGDTMKYIVNYENSGTERQNQLIVRTVLPAKTTLVPGSTMVYNSVNPGGIKFNGDGINQGGIIIGDYTAGATAYVTYEVRLPAAEQLTCGNNDFRSTATAKPQASSDEYTATALTTVRKDCDQNGVTPAANGTTPAPGEQGDARPAAAYACDLLTLTKATDGSRKLTANVDYTAKDGASLKMVKYDFGDGSQPLMTDKPTAEYAYPRDGDYTVVASLTMSVDGRDRTVTSDACAKTVNFTAPTTPAAPAASTTLPETGTGSIAGLFILASLAGFVGHKLLLGRRPARG